MEDLLLQEDIENKNIDLRIYKYKNIETQKYKNTKIYKHKNIQL